MYFSTKPLRADLSYRANSLFALWPHYTTGVYFHTKILFRTILIVMKTIIFKAGQDFLCNLCAWQNASIREPNLRLPEFSQTFHCRQVKRRNHRTWFMLSQTGHHTNSGRPHRRVNQISPCQSSYSLHNLQSFYDNIQGDLAEQLSCDVIYTWMRWEEVNCIHSATRKCTTHRPSLKCSQRDPKLLLPCYFCIANPASYYSKEVHWSGILSQVVYINSPILLPRIQVDHLQLCAKTHDIRLRPTLRWWEIGGERSLRCDSLLDNSQSLSSVKAYNKSLWSYVSYLSLDVVNCDMLYIVLFVFVTSSLV